MFTFCFKEKWVMDWCVNFNGNVKVWFNGLIWLLVEPLSDGEKKLRKLSNHVVKVQWHKNNFSNDAKPLKHHRITLINSRTQHYSHCTGQSSSSTVAWYLEGISENKLFVPWSKEIITLNIYSKLLMAYGYN